MATEAPLSRDERLDANLRRHDALLSDALGCGVRGTVFVLERQRATGRMRSAVKFHEHREPYLRERDCYLRLWDHQVDEILGHQVPQLINFDDDLLAIEMTIVVRPVRISTCRRTTMKKSSTSGDATRKNSSSTTGQPPAQFCTP
jgi:hypothetical protein